MPAPAWPDGKAAAWAAAGPSLPSWALPMPAPHGLQPGRAAGNVGTQGHRDTRTPGMGVRGAGSMHGVGTVGRRGRGEPGAGGLCRHRRGRVGIFLCIYFLVIFRMFPVSKALVP